jgi:hypothetical protein
METQPVTDNQPVIETFIDIQLVTVNDNQPITIIFTDTSSSKHVTATSIDTDTSSSTRPNPLT